jgi:hypothetical protein
MLTADRQGYKIMQFWVITTNVGGAAWTLITLGGNE